MKLLVADIGGTNARFAYQEENNSDLNNFAYLKCSDYENIYNAIAVSYTHLTLPTIVRV